MAYQKLNLAEQLDGSLWLMQPIAGRFRMQQQHTHRELEFNLVLSGRGAYVIDERRYELSRGTLLWLFPRQQHVLVDISDDFAMWIGVFKPKLLRRACRTAQTQPLRRLLPRGLFCKQLVIDPLERLDGFCDDLATWESTPDRYNAGLAHLLMQAWWAFEEADEITQTMDIHAAVERAARMLRDCLAQIDANVACVLAGDGIGGPHQLRVGLRRLRSLFAIFRGELDGPALRGLNDAARSLAGQAGRLRDLDVLAEEMLPRAARLAGAQTAEARDADAAGLEAQEAAWRADILSAAPNANAWTKRLLFSSRRLSRADQRALAGQGFGECLMGPEGREGVASFIEKRRPSWAPAKRRSERLLP